MLKRAHIADAQHACGMDKRVNVRQRKRSLRNRRTIREIECNRLKLFVRDRRRRNVQPDHPPALNQQRIGNRETDAGAAASDNRKRLIQT